MHGPVAPTPAHRTVSLVNATGIEPVSHKALVASAKIRKRGCVVKTYRLVLSGRSGAVGASALTPVDQIPDSVREQGPVFRRLGNVLDNPKKFKTAASICRRALSGHSGVSGQRAP